MRSTGGHSWRNSRYNGRRYFAPCVGEAELNRRSNIWKSTILRHRCARWLGAASVLVTLFIFGLSVASTADSQTTQPHAKAAAPAKAAVDSVAPVKSYGSSSAPITMEVFTDYECPSCRNLFEQTLRPLISGYVADGKVYLVHRDFPLPMHRYGYEAARWLNASARAGQFQAVESALYDNQDAWAADGNIAKYVSAAMSPEAFKRVQTLMHGCADPNAAGVKTTSFNLASQSGQSCALDSYIELDRALGNKIPVQATPTFVITYKGKHLPAGSGFVSYPILKQFFDSLLSQ
jgi:protein-disulfide isomerase